MNTKKLNDDLLELIELRNKIANLGYNDDNYDELEEEVAEIEDDFNLKYGVFLEKAIQNIHNKIAPAIDTLLPTAYLARKYMPSVVDEGSFDLEPNSGILLESKFDNAQGQAIPAFLVLAPTPPRLILTYQGDMQTVWNAENPDSYQFPVV